MSNKRSKIETCNPEIRNKFFLNFSDKIDIWNNLVWNLEKDEQNKLFNRNKRLILQKEIITQAREIFCYSNTTVDVDIIRALTKYKNNLM